MMLILLSPELSSHEVGVDYPSEGWAVTWHVGGISWHHVLGAVINIDGDHQVHVTHTAHRTLHPPARGHQENFFPIPSLFVEEKCGKQSWKYNRLNEGSRMIFLDLSLLEKKSFNPITKSPLPKFISDKLNVSGQIIYFLYWKVTHRKITKLGFSKNIC